MFILRLLLAGRIVSLLNSHLNTDFLINDLFFDLSVKKSATVSKEQHEEVS